MKAWTVFSLIFAFAAVSTPAFSTPNSQTGAAVSKYDSATEAVFKGTVEEVKDHQCPVSRGMGAHLVLKLADGTSIEVHLAPTKFDNDYEIAFNKGDVLEVTGSKVKFEGVDTILAREVRRGSDVFVFRDKDGKPVW